jgi:hypothetical protein
MQIIYHAIKPPIYFTAIAVSKESYDPDITIMIEALFKPLPPP